MPRQGLLKGEGSAFHFTRPCIHLTLTACYPSPFSVSAPVTENKPTKHCYHIERVYIDTVGIPQSYQAKLDRIFQGLGIQFTVEKKADSKYASCSAASICAKVIRDDLTANWKWSEPHFEPSLDETTKSKSVSESDSVDDAPKKQVIAFGSGYPSDPKCKAWMGVRINRDATVVA
jgi:ribonuclease HII